MVHPTITRSSLQEQRPAHPDVIAHFHASADLYRSWSRSGHLHFGYWRWPLSPLNRASMLDELVHHVVRALRPMPGHELADLGCGYGAAARLAAGTYSCQVDGFTVVPEQVEQGELLATRENVPVRMHLKDFRETGLPKGTMDGVYAIESICYGSGPSKRDVLDEAARILKPGGRLALVDGFLLKEPGILREPLVRTVEKGWALPCFPFREDLLAAMAKAGFRQVKVEDLSFRIAICAAHGFPLMLWTVLKRSLAHRHFDALERAHLKSCMLGILLGTQLDLFRYSMITATKE